MLGIVNGTTNYILTQMSERGWGVRGRAGRGAAPRLRGGRSDRRRRWVRRGGEVRDPRLDRVQRARRRRATSTARGSRGVTAQDIADAARLGYVVKLLAIAELDDERDLRARAPGDGPGDAPARQRSATRTTRCSSRARQVGQLMFYGPGRRRRRDGDERRRRPRPRGAAPRLRRSAIGCTCVLERRDPSDGRHDTASTTSTSTSRIAPACSPRSPRRSARNGVSIERVWQEGFGEEATLVFITHRAQEGAFQKTVRRAPRSRESCARWRASCGWRARSERAPEVQARTVARRDRGVPGPPAGLRRDAGDHPPRGRHAARPFRSAVGSRPDARSG